jgi:hypothetical protein
VKQLVSLSTTLPLAASEIACDEEALCSARGNARVL